MLDVPQKPAPDWMDREPAQHSVATGADGKRDARERGGGPEVERVRDCVESCVDEQWLPDIQVPWMAGMPDFSWPVGEAAEERPPAGERKPLALPEYFLEPPSLRPTKTPWLHPTSLGEIQPAPNPIRAQPTQIASGSDGALHSRWPAKEHCNQAMRH